jgi:hypothetical protein
LYPFARGHKCPRGSIGIEQNGHGRRPAFTTALERSANDWAVPRFTDKDRTCSSGSSASVDASKNSNFVGMGASGCWPFSGVVDEMKIYNYGLNLKEKAYSKKLHHRYSQ